MDIGGEFLHIADAALKIADTAIEEEQYHKLSVLLDLEDVLDKGRLVMAAAGSNVTPVEINERMDVLRAKITDLVDSLPVEEYRQYREERAKAEQLRFTR